MVSIPSSPLYIFCFAFRSDIKLISTWWRSWASTSLKNIPVNHIVIINVEWPAIKFRKISPERNFSQSWNHFNHMIFFRGSEKIKHSNNKFSSTIIINRITIQSMLLDQTIELALNVFYSCLSMTIFIWSIFENMTLSKIRNLLKISKAQVIELITAFFRILSL